MAECGKKRYSPGVLIDDCLFAPASIGNFSSELYLVTSNAHNAYTHYNRHILYMFEYTLSPQKLVTHMYAERYVEPSRDFIRFKLPYSSSFLLIEWNTSDISQKL